MSPDLTVIPFPKTDSPSSSHRNHVAELTNPPRADCWRSAPGYRTSPSSFFTSVASPLTPTSIDASAVEPTNRLSSSKWFHRFLRKTRTPVFNLQLPRRGGSIKQVLQVLKTHKEEPDGQTSGVGSTVSEAVAIWYWSATPLRPHKPGLEKYLLVVGGSLWRPRPRITTTNTFREKQDNLWRFKLQAVKADVTPANDPPSSSRVCVRLAGQQ